MSNQNKFMTNFLYITSSFRGPWKYNISVVLLHAAYVKARVQSTLSIASTFTIKYVLPQEVLPFNITNDSCFSFNLASYELVGKLDTV